MEHEAEDDIVAVTRRVTAVDHGRSEVTWDAPITDPGTPVYRMQAGEGSLVPQGHGGALRPGGDGVSGGRRSAAAKRRLEKIRDVALDALETPGGIMSNPGHKNFPRLFQIVQEAVDGKPVVQGAKEAAPTQVQVIVINGQRIAF